MLTVKNQEVAASRNVSTPAQQMTSAERVTAAVTKILDQVSFSQRGNLCALEKMLDGTVTPRDLDRAREMQGTSGRQFGRQSGKLSIWLKNPPQEPGQQQSSFIDELRRPVGLGHEKPNHEQALAPLFAELVEAVQARLSQQGPVETGVERFKDWLA